MAQQKRESGGHQRAESEGGSKGGSRREHSGKGDREGTKRDREGGEKTGASFHRITYTGPGKFQYGPNTRAFSYSECQRCLVEQFNCKPRDCEGMCFECGADQDGGKASVLPRQRMVTRGKTRGLISFPRVMLKSCV